MTEAMEEAEEAKETADVEVSQIQGDLADANYKITALQRKLHDSSVQYGSVMNDYGNLHKTCRENTKLAEKANTKFSQMEVCANIAVGNAKVAVEAVNACVLSCSECIEACKVNDSEKAATAAAAAQTAGERAFEASKRAADVNNPSPLAQQAYDEAYQEAENSKS